MCVFVTRMAFSYEFPRPSVTVDCVVFGVDLPRSEAVEVLLIRREIEPFRGSWALPGGFVRVSDAPDQGESLEDAARRELQEETGARVDYLEQLYTFGAPGRDPRGRVISVAYFALVRSKDHALRATTDASDAAWFPVRDALALDLAFDHEEIVEGALARLAAKVRYAPIGFNLLPTKFTLSELQRLYEAILLRPLDKRNFRKRFLAMGLLVEAGVEDGTGRPGPAARLFRFDKRAYDAAVKRGFDFEI
jgi:8-oxo-dGTP diphosphatase